MRTYCNDGSSVVKYTNESHLRLHIFYSCPVVVGWKGLNDLKTISNVLASPQMGCEMPGKINDWTEPVEFKVLVTSVRWIQQKICPTVNLNPRQDQHPQDTQLGSYSYSEDPSQNAWTPIDRSDRVVWLLNINNQTPSTIVQSRECGLLKEECTHWEGGVYGHLVCTVDIRYRNILMYVINTRSQQYVTLYTFMTGHVCMSNIAWNLIPSLDTVQSNWRFLILYPRHSKQRPNTLPNKR